MIFGLRKKTPESQETEKSEKEATESKSRKSQKTTGSRWSAMVLLAVSLIMGMSFWLYGKLSGGETQKVREGVKNEKSSKIIFEKQADPNNPSKIKPSPEPLPTNTGASDMTF